MTPAAQSVLVFATVALAAGYLLARAWRQHRRRPATGCGSGDTGCGCASTRGPLQARLASRRPTPKSPSALR